MKNIPVGTNVLLSEDTYEVIIWDSQSISGYPSATYVARIEPYVGKYGQVTGYWKQGGHVTVTFEDGVSFCMKPQWVEVVRESTD